MGGNGVTDAQAQKIVCEFHGAKVDAEIGELRAQVLELVRRKVAGGAVSGTTGGRLEITAELDPQAIEALRLEIRRLARRYGADIDRFGIERPGEVVASGSRRTSGEMA